MCDRCDTVLLQNPMDPFAEPAEVDTPQSMPLLIGRDVYDFTAQVKKFYYHEDTWNVYSSVGKQHALKWFGRTKAARQIDDIVSLFKT